jgi:hypothetical protein
MSANEPSFGGVWKALKALAKYEKIDVLEAATTDRILDLIEQVKNHHDRKAKEEHFERYVDYAPVYKKLLARLQHEPHFFLKGFLAVYALLQEHYVANRDPNVNVAVIARTFQDKEHAEEIQSIMPLLTVIDLTDGKESVVKLIESACETDLDVFDRRRTLEVCTVTKLHCITYLISISVCISHQNRI